MISINKNLIAIFALSAFLFAGCIQQSNTYPVEIFSEMHYNQAQKYQEPPRVPAHPDSVPFNGIGEKSNLDMSQKIQSINNGSELYSVNCAFCHGDMGDGYGPAAEKITSKDNYWYSVTGEAHKNPANLIVSELSKENAVVFIKGGAGLMPAYKNMLTEEEIESIVDYVWDDLR